MRVALLNLPFDNNYGGNLQRFALIYLIRSLGHDVVHINLQRKPAIKWYIRPLSLAKRLFYKYVRNISVPINEKEYIQYLRNLYNGEATKFYNQYVKHTEVCYGVEDVKRICLGKFDAYIVGSDQVWRYSMTKYLGIKNYFLDFLIKEDVIRIAFSVSLGTKENEYPENLLDELRELYGKFNAVSVRELSAIDMFNQYNFNHPRAQVTLDPTFLVDIDVYDNIILNHSVLPMTKNKIYCYILDYSEEKEKYIKEESKRRKMELEVDGISLKTKLPSIPQWLSNIKESEFVITDSYHGLVFSLIYRKKYICLLNSSRGNARFMDLFSLLEIKNGELPKQETLDRLKKMSKSIIESALRK